MAAFPALEPLRREWEFPRFPSLDYEGLGGSTISFEYGAIASDQPLTLVFELISEAEMQLIRDHYLAQQSVHPFPLPAICLAGYVNPADFFDPTQQWLYDGEPEEQLVSYDNYRVDVALRSVRL